jgi:hypothetical protein
MCGRARRRNAVDERRGTGGRGETPETNTKVREGGGAKPAMSSKVWDGGREAHEEKIHGGYYCLGRVVGGHWAG